MSDESTPIEDAASRRVLSARNAVKLRALVRNHFGVEADAVSVGTGAASAIDGRAFVLLDGGPGLGAALAWARRSACTELHVVADPGHPDSSGDVADISGGDIARQAAEFRTPISVWRSEGTDLVPVEATPPSERLGPPDAPDLVAVLRDEGLDVVVEGDRLAGEFRGLEIARIVRALDDGEPILEVGVGRHDRALTAMMHGDLDARSSIARVVEQLRLVRVAANATRHPLASLVPERWLRDVLVRDPDRIGCRELVSAPAATPRDRLRPRGIAAATGTRDGQPVVVVTSVGVDLEAPVLAADTRRSLDPTATLLLVLPARDVFEPLSAMVEDLVHPAEIVTVPDDWRA